MKIAVTYENGEIFGHFGHTEQFKVYEIENGEIFQHFGHTKAFKLYKVENGEITESKVVETMGSGHGALAGMLQILGADVLICGGIGMGAQMALCEAGIKLYGGARGNADKAVEAFLINELKYDPDAKCDHHGHGEGHTCGNHGCGNNTCGHN